MKKLETDYDLMNSVSKVNDKEGILKVAKLEKRKLFRNLVLYLGAIDLIGGRTHLLKYIPLEIGAVLIGRGIYTAKKGNYPKEGKLELEILSDDIERHNDLLNIKTNEDLLAKAKLEGKVYNFKLNDHKIPVLLQSKLISVPAFNENGEIENVSVLQEHVLGSNVYKLSLSK